MGPADSDGVVAPVPVDPQREVLVVQARQIEDVPTHVACKRDAVAAGCPTLYEPLEIGQMVGDLWGENVDVRTPGRHPVVNVLETERAGDRRPEPAADGHPRGEQGDGYHARKVTVTRVALDLKYG